MPNYQFICFGEILWDVFPTPKVIGGAPLNVALRLHSLDATVGIISCIGKDPYGSKVTEYLEDHKLSQELIQVHDTLATGFVEITLDDTGSASYEIGKPVAWDAIQLYDSMIAAVRDAPYFLFGSLALRGARNRATLEGLLKVAKTAIFDVNLRAPHYDISMIYELMQRAHFIKLNDEELIEICDRLGCVEKSMERQIQWICKTTNTKTVCVTRGDKGAMLFYNEIFYSHEGFKVEVEDTVGAGDSFLATLLHSLLTEESEPQFALARACAVGALVTSKAGANCEVTEIEIQNMMEKT